MTVRLRLKLNEGSDEQNIKAMQNLVIFFISTVLSYL